MAKRTYTEDEQQCISMQQTINGGTAWKFEGSYGRAMMDSITSGVALLGKKPARDYYGNYIPSRYDVKPGTKGSFQYVVEALGKSFAMTLAKLN